MSIINSKVPFYPSIKMKEHDVHIHSHRKEHFTASLDFARAHSLSHFANSRLALHTTVAWQLMR